MSSYSNGCTWRPIERRPWEDERRWPPYDPRGPTHCPYPFPYPRGPDIRYPPRYPRPYDYNPYDRERRKYYDY